VGESTAQVVLKRGEDKRIRSGHLWVFSNEIAGVEGSVNPGDTVHVHSDAGRFLGTGYINPHSLIAVRLVSRSRVEISREFIARRVDAALALRERIWPGETAYRAIYGDADLLSGLVVDRYGDTVAVQSLTAGIERRIDDVIDVLIERMSPANIVLRNDSPMRAYEDLPQEKSIVRGASGSPVEIEQDGLRFLVDVMEGQKTGFFFDQRENRLATAHLAKAKDVLDCCSYTGAWSAYAARAGASSVACVDSSSSALELAERNVGAVVGDVEARFVKADVFKHLAKLGRGKKRFGLVVLDPPAFAKSRKKIRAALKAYRALNRLAMTVTKPGGHLVTCTCSHLVERDAFMHALVGAAKEANRRARVVEVRGQSRDHPVILGLPETDYLKCVVMEVL
jgi:23S rRNA (cytosine1962-C5)-methyltransferase